ncbi:DUF6273 domain-containing protein [Enterocloster sp. OA13]|uniref:DUF6273 domain-containing protein n=1 Tax=Enterocloster sp. OA13 TaxID=2914161 RepID=UPI001F0552DD|nr:DUF6273 domain-containing protein [Enterocloster sp. OA13]
MVGNIKRITVSLYWGFDYEETIDGITIHITASNGILPKNVEVRIIKVNQDNELEKVLRDSIEGFKKDETVAFDISFWDGNDEIQIENGKVNVSFICPKLSVDGETTVFHIDDDQNLELIPSRQESDGISFEADHFSVYGFTTTYTQDTDPLGNPLIGGTTSGDWKGNYIYFGWEGLESNKHSGNDNWLEIKDYVNDREFYRLNGQLYSGADLMTPIKWRILNNNGSALLLLADEMLDVYNYGTANNDHPTWETSDMRRWLNDEFMANHFTLEEQTDIKESTVTDIVNSDSNLPEGNSTEDKIFLPSKEELTDEGYGFPINGESLSRKTTYNNDSLRSSNTASDRSYWTRSRGDLNYTLLRPVFVTEKGLCGYGANRYCSWILGVRPMLRLDLDSQRFGLNKTDSNLNAGIKFDKSALEMKVGDIKDLEVAPINIDDNLTNLKWISTNPSVVSIGVDGKLSAMSNGTANIYAIQGQYIAMCRVTVTESQKRQYKVTFKDGDTIVREVMVEDGTAATPPTIIKDGYTLAWDKDFSSITDETIINAIWTGNTHAITYVLNGGINHSLNPATYVVGGNGVVLQRPTRKDYIFGGWYTTPTFKVNSRIDLIGLNTVGDLVIYAKWMHEGYDGFSTETDGWCIANSRLGFGYDNNYRIPVERYSDTYGLDIMALLELTGTRIVKWSGNCFGLSTLAVADYIGKIDLDDYMSGAGQDIGLYYYGYQDIYKTEEGKDYFTLDGNGDIIELIERVMISQNSMDVKNCRVFEDYAKNNYRDLIDYLNSSSAKPLVFCITKTHHAVVIETAKKPTDMGEGWVRIPIYDCNYPNNSVMLENPHDSYLNSTAYFDVNTESGQWIYSSHGIERKSGNTNSNMYFYDLSKLPDNFFSKKLEYDPLKAFIYFNGSDYSLYDCQNNKMAEVKNNDLVYCSDICEFVPYCEGGGDLGGFFNMPIQPYTVKGACSFGLLSEHHVTVGKIDGGTLAFDCNTGELSIKGTGNTEICLQQNDERIAVSISDYVKTDESIGILINKNIVISTDKIQIAELNIEKDGVIQSFNNINLEDINGKIVQGIEIIIGNRTNYINQYINRDELSDIVEGSWEKNDKGWWYRYEGGTWSSNGFYYIDYNKRYDWYYFDENGYMMTGWILWNGYWYYLNPDSDGTMGAMTTGWKDINGAWYYFDPTTGAMKTGWIKLEDKWYYLGVDGILFVNTTTPDGYHVNEKGEWIQ